VDPGRLRCGERVARPRPEDGVFRDQGPVEVARERLDVARKLAWELQP
jgi:hypothetical protein